MISTGIDTRIKVQQIIENQLPEFILSESPKAVDFLKQYYISQEYTGGPIDLTDNLDQYLKLDNLTPETLKGSVTLDVSISSTDSVINISPNQKDFQTYGLLKLVVKSSHTLVLLQIPLLDVNVDSVELQLIEILTTHQN